ncbi:uncharacterized protein LACBIDRAFT_316264 [Laccaria bicolor S238N-H82]|uniref:Predicted protein n=1 Tax=Laccaria bicolor (strain S238N-H82 / ATCC MYA-4686) TaxID=486041 RepID=B0E0K6_LACBS|nr:uncharacterized protein LACBIDRAFT_316264 [Laccaria bicolor S238N-H82]EDQ99602.1 predicted protein [Laccaria bicolor S238N-H82]|eukprot:XP_001889713.1 predicted protein [Laccaria bicolor S238N-H82]
MVVYPTVHSLSPLTLVDSRSLNQPPSYSLPHPTSPLFIIDLCFPDMEHNGIQYTTRTFSHPCLLGISLTGPVPLSNVSCAS